MLRMGEGDMSQIDIEHVKKLIEKAKELEKATSELYEKVKSSDLIRAVEKLSELNDTLKAFVLRDYTKFSITIIDACVSSQCEDIELVVGRESFRYAIRVKRSTSIVDIYKTFFDANSVLEQLIDDLLGAMINVASEVKKNTDLLDKISKLERNIEWINTELDEIKEKLEDP